VLKCAEDDLVTGWNM